MTEPSEKERALTTVVSADNFNLLKTLPLLTLVLEGNRVSTKNSLKRFQLGNFRPLRTKPIVVDPIKILLHFTGCCAFPCCVKHQSETTVKFQVFNDNVGIQQ